jgi:hypothetical protein
VSRGPQTRLKLPTHCCCSDKAFAPVATRPMGGRVGGQPCMFPIKVRVAGLMSQTPLNFLPPPMTSEQAALSVAHTLRAGDVAAASTALRSCLKTHPDGLRLLLDQLCDQFPVQGCKTLANMCARNDVTHDALMRAGLADLLAERVAKVFRAADVQAGYDCLAIFLELTRSSSVQPLLDHGIPALLVAAGCSNDVQLRAVKSMCRFDKGCQAMVDAGVARVFVAALPNLVALRALPFIIEVPAGAAAIVQAEGCAKLQQLISTAHSEEAFLAIAGLAKQSPAARALFQNPKFAQAVLIHPDRASDAALLACQVVVGDGNAAPPFDSTDLVVVETRLVIPQAQLAMYAGVVAALSGAGPWANRAIMDSGAVQELVRTLPEFMDNARDAFEIAKALVRLSQVHATRVELVKCGAVPHIIQAILREGNPKSLVTGELCRALGHLADDQGACAQLCMHLGIAELLGDILSTCVQGAVTEWRFPPLGATFALFKMSERQDGLALLGSQADMLIGVASALTEPLRAALKLRGKETKDPEAILYLYRLIANVASDRVGELAPVLRELLQLLEAYLVEAQEVCAAFEGLELQHLADAYRFEMNTQIVFDAVKRLAGEERALARAGASERSLGAVRATWPEPAPGQTHAEDCLGADEECREVMSFIRKAVLASPTWGPAHVALGTMLR